ncbi:arylsulfatase B-like [Babylonia areolata]|uniref:arylsulfatase B-like n=1 Tax=Babylonia areolata TaxID=304850 RepID=UPI003FCF5D1C
MWPSLSPPPLPPPRFSFLLPLLLWLTALAAVTSGVRGQGQDQGQGQGQGQGQSRPNIILFLADDLGWADLQRHDPEMRTPALERLAEHSMVLNFSYVMPTCAPTRSALLTGRYPFTYGMQVNDIKGARRSWLDETLTLLPATLRDLGYSTHMIGKWHLGFCDWSLTPTRRGFDTFYGFYSGAQGYFNHSGNSPYAYDFRDGDEVVWSARGHYSTELHTARAQRIIRDHASRSRSGSRSGSGSGSGSPFFLYMSYQSVHAPFEAKQRYVDQYCSHVRDETRRVHCAMVAALDESVGNITRTLDQQGLRDNTLVVFLSDNGGPTEGGSFNYPLRGKKATLWEGGTRVFSLLSSPLLSRSDGFLYPGMIHAIDWYPTLVQAAGGTAPSGLDGVAMWRQLRDNQQSPREEFVYNVDDVNRRSALRWKKWKLTKGKPGRSFNGWYPPPSLQSEGVPWVEVHRRRVPRWQLFDLSTDPEERHNLFPRRRNRNRNRNLMRVINQMKRKLRAYERRLQPFEEAPRVRAGNPRNTGGVYSPGWCTP